MSDRGRFRVWKIVLCFVIFLASWKLFFWEQEQLEPEDYLHHIVDLKHAQKEEILAEKNVEIPTGERHTNRHHWKPHDENTYVHMDLDGEDFAVNVPGGFEIMRMVDGEWHTDPTVCRTTETFPVHTLNTPTGDIKISLYSTKDNDAVSAKIRETGSWELDIVTTIHEILRKHPDWVFIDIGAHLGVYTLSMAKSGFDVIALEPLVPNIQRMCQSLEMGEYKGIVRVIHNAVSDKEGNIAIRNENGKEFTEETIMLDELSVLFLLKSVILRIDTGKHQAKVLKGAKQFLTHVKVRYLLMEFPKAEQNTEESSDIIQFLLDQNMKPAMPSNPRLFLSTSGHIEWPTTVLWVKMS